MRGIAIMAIMLHNYCHWLNFAVKENEYQFHSDRAAAFWQSLTTPDGMLPIQLLSFLGHYGVPVFLFLSGYGLVLKYERENEPSYRPLPFIKFHYLITDIELHIKCHLIVTASSSVKLLACITDSVNQIRLNKTVNVLVFAGNLQFSTLNII